MSKFCYTLITISVAVFVSMTFPGCTNANARSDGHDPDSIDAQLTDVRNALIGDDVSAIAAQFDYPIARPYPLRDISDSASMVRYIPTLIDDSLKMMLSGLNSTDWQPVGWRGWTPTEDGSVLWWDGTIYALNYISGKERKLKNMLEREEIESLHPSLRKGWHPYYCMVATDNGMIFRIDISNDVDNNKSSKVRILAYDSPSSLSELPDINLIGQIEYEGSAGNRTLHFSSGSTAIYFIMDSSDDSRPEIEVFYEGKTTKHPVEAVYWRDYLRDKEK